MAKKSHKENVVGPWARQKLDALRDYLNFYTIALKNQKQWKLIYIDAFAGPGLSKVRNQQLTDEAPVSLFDLDAADISETEAYLKGSPTVALELENAFDEYIFIERDAERAQELRGLAAEIADGKTVSVIEDDASKVLVELANSKIDRKRNRAVAFIDPYGVSLSWEAVQALGETGAVEIIINFAWAMAINRLMVKGGDIPPNWRSMLNNFFGTEDWYALIYEKRDDLFGEHTVKAADAGERILSFYLDKLRGCFGYVAPPMLVRNTRGNPLYYLIWAGPNKLGLKGARHVLAQGERISGKRWKK